LQSGRRSLSEINPIRERRSPNLGGGGGEERKGFTGGSTRKRTQPEERSTHGPWKQKGSAAGIRVQSPEERKESREFVSELCDVLGKAGSDYETGMKETGSRREKSVTGKESEGHRLNN